MRSNSSIPAETEVNNVGDDNDTNELAHNDSDSPGMAAKKARLRQAMADASSAKPRNRAGATGDLQSLQPLKALARMLKPKKLGAETVKLNTDNDLEHVKLDNDQSAGLKQTMRQAEAKGDTAMLRRFTERLKAW